MTEPLTPWLAAFFIRFLRRRTDQQLVAYAIHYAGRAPELQLVQAEQQRRLSQQPYSIP